MQKNVLKHQYENFSTASNEILDKAYDRFQKLISQLEVHDAPISKEDINQKFLRSLPSSWNQIALIMRNKPDIDEIDIDDLYNNLRVYEDELKRSSGSNSASQNLAFLSSENTGTYSFLAQPTTSSQLENEDFQQMDEDDLEELDLRLQVAMLTNLSKLCFDGTSSSSSSSSLLTVSQMSARDKIGLGYSTQLNELSSNHETDSENSFSVFDGRSSDEESTLANDRSSKEDVYKAVPPPPITGNFLTSRADISFAGLDKYVIRNKIIESQTTELNTKTSETAGKTNVANTEKPKSVNDEEEGYEMQTVRPETQTLKTRDDKSGQTSKQGIGFQKVKACFVLKEAKQEILLQTMKISLVDLGFGSDPKEHGSKFNLFFVSQMCDKKNSVLFTESECLILSPSFKLLDESQVVLRAPRKDGVYNFRLKNLFPSGGKSPSISFMRPFGCPLTILNTLDFLGKFDGKSDEGYFLGYSTSSKAFRVYNKRTKRVEENLHIHFLEDQLNVTGTGPNWMFDLDFLTNSMNYIPEYILLPLQPHRIRILIEDVAPVAHETPSESSPKENDVQDSEDAANKESEQDIQYELEKMVTIELAAKAMDDISRQAFEEEKRRIASKKKVTQATSTNKLSTDRPSISTSRPSISTDRPSISTDRPFVSTDRSNTPYVSAAITSTSANAGESSFVYLGGKIPIDASTLPNVDLPIDPNMPDLEDASDTLPNDGIFNGSYDDDEDVGAVTDFNNMDNTIAVSPIPTLRIHKDHPKGQILGDPTLAVQTRGKIQKAYSAQQALVLVDVPYGKKVTGTKWVFRNKRDERSIVVKNKARLIAQGFRQEEGLDYDGVFAPVARIKAIRLFLAFASYMGFTVYQMDVKSAFLYGTIEEEVYVHQPLGFVNPAHPNKVYKVIKALYGLHQAPRACYETLSSFLMENGF
ncbi:putative ribonuclease H-like domain-containing protein [Tanacetum coccineum]